MYADPKTVAPAHLLRESTDAEADRFLIKKDVSFAGLSRLARTQDAYFRGVPFEGAKPIREVLVTRGS